MHRAEVLQAIEDENDVVLKEMNDQGHPVCDDNGEKLNIQLEYDPEPTLGLSPLDLEHLLDEAEGRKEDE